MLSRNTGHSCFSPGRNLWLPVFAAELQLTNKGITRLQNFPSLTWLTDDLRGLAAILGHSNLNTVMIYTTPTVAELTSRMEKAELANLSRQDSSVVSRR